MVTLCSMSFIQVDQECVVETDTTVSNTGEDIMRETGENAVSLSNSNKRPITLIDTEDDSAGEGYFLPMKRFQTAPCSHNINGVFRKIFVLMF